MSTFHAIDFGLTAVLPRGAVSLKLSCKREFVLGAIYVPPSVLAYFRISSVRSVNVPPSLYDILGIEGDLPSNPAEGRVSQSLTTPDQFDGGHPLRLSPCETLFPNQFLVVDAVNLSDAPQFLRGYLSGTVASVG